MKSRRRKETELGFIAGIKRIVTESVEDKIDSATNSSQKENTKTKRVSERVEQLTPMYIDLILLKMGNRSRMACA
jgi:hypothetical protein